MTGTTVVNRTRFWIMAVRPKTLSASAAPVLIGAGLAGYHAVFKLIPVLATLVCAILIQIGTNLANDYYDFLHEADTETRVGPIRVTQSGLIPPNQVWWGMVITLFMSFLIGIYLFSVGGWPILWIGVTSIICAVVYTGGPYPLAYHGLGDLFVFLFFGLIAVGGTYWIQALGFSGDVFLAGVGIGSLNTAILVANNVRDIETDAVAGKKTIAVRIGRYGSRIEYVLLVGMGFLVPVLGVAVYGWPKLSLSALGASVLLVAPLTLVLTKDSASELMPALSGTARVVALYGILLSLGLAFG